MPEAAERLRDAYERELGRVAAFLPASVPATRLPERLQPYLHASGRLALHYPAACGGVRGWLERELPAWDRAGSDAIAGLEEFERDALMTALSALAHAWRWHTVPPAPERFAERRPELPDVIAAPWRAVAASMDIPMVGSTWTLHLCNWRSSTLSAGGAYDPAQLELADLDVAVQWLAPPFDEEWRHFSLIFVLTEARAAAALRAAVTSIAAADEGDAEGVAGGLAALQEGIDDIRRPMTALLRPPYVEPAHWLDVIQPTMPWAAEAPDGTEPPGPNGLQLPVLHCLDAALGVASRTVISGEAVAARAQMPVHHRRFLGAVDETGPVLRRFVAWSGDRELAWSFNDCVKALRSWRLVHQRRGARYLRGSRGEHARVSTGMSVPWRDNAGGAAAGTRDVGERDPVAFFEAVMSERISETIAAALPAAARPGDAPGVDDALALLTGEQRKRLFEVGEWRQYPAGEQLIAEGARAQPLQFIETGEARVLVGGRPIERTRVRPGELVGEVSFLDGGDASASVEAADEVEAIVLTRERVAALLDADPALAAAVYRSLGAMAARRLRALG